MRINILENFRAVFYTPFYAAFELRAYEAEGLDVHRTMSTQPAETMQLLLRGEADVAWGGPIRHLAEKNRDPNSVGVIFCDVVGRDPFFLVAREPNQNFQLSDLMGKRVGVVSEVPTPWLCLQHDLLQAGLDPANVTATADRTMAENIAALGAGEVDIIQVFQPYVEQALEEHHANIWYSASDRGPTAYTALYTTQGFRDQNSESLLRMTRGVYRTQAWIASHPASELAALVAEYFPDVPQARLTRALDRYKNAGLWNLTPILPSEGFAWLDAACRSTGFTQIPVTYEQCVDMSFAEEVIKNPAEAL